MYKLLTEHQNNSQKLLIVVKCSYLSLALAKSYNSYKRQCSMNFLFQCTRKWLFKHQHKLKQALRTCSLKVQEDDPTEDFEVDSEYSFRVSKYFIYI